MSGAGQLTYGPLFSNVGSTSVLGVLHSRGHHAPHGGLRWPCQRPQRTRKRSRVRVCMYGCVISVVYIV